MAGARARTRHHRHSFTSFWTNRDGIGTEYVRAYAKLATALAGEDAVIGYDAFNEPACELTVAPCGVPPQAAAAAAYLEPFDRELVPTLRRAHGVRVVRRAPLTLRGSGRASITVTRR